jgi:hypothetical protein
VSVHLSPKPCGLYDVAWQSSMMAQATLLVMVPNLAFKDPESACQSAHISVATHCR